MSKDRSYLFILPILLFSLVGCQKAIQTVVDQTTGLGVVEQKFQTDKDLATIQARTIFRQAQMDEKDLSAGPCLSENLIPDWVLDVAHNPRQPIDDLPANQCQAFRSGRTHHFVEMDEWGQVIKIY
jgi:hypothetical protein